MIVASLLLEMMRSREFGWDAERVLLYIDPLCADLERAISELQAARAVLRSDQNAQSLAYGERFRSGAADERELRNQIGVLRSLLVSSGRAEEARELRRIRPRPRRERSERRAQEAPETAVRAPETPRVAPPPDLRMLGATRKPRRMSYRRRLQRWAAKIWRPLGTS